MVHLEVEGEYSIHRGAGDFGGAVVNRRELNLEDWTYVALGHYHTQHQVARNAWYAGALDYIGPNIWGERADESEHGDHGKGWLLVDLDSGKVERRRVPAAREVLDLEPVRAENKSAAAIDAEIAFRLATLPGGISDKIVRLRVYDIPRHVARELNHAAIRGYKADALHFHLDLRRPELQRTVGVGAPGPRQTLPELVSSYLAGRPLPAELDRGEFVRLGQELMDTGRTGSGRRLMQINRIRLVNFRQHENTEIEFGPGLTGIVGPNGAGKTTLLEAIAWAMYGMPAARGNRETLRRRGAPPRARVEVEVEFTLGAHDYRIVRSLNQAELYQDGDAAPVAYSMGSVTERVTRLLGMTRDEFFNTYFTGQKELAVMAAMSAPERAQFLSRVLGYERLRAAQDRLKEKRSALRARVDALRAGLPDLAELDQAQTQAEERLTRAQDAEVEVGKASDLAERRLGEIRPRWEQLQQQRETALALEAELRVADHQATTAAQRIARLEQEALELAAAREQLAELSRQLSPLPTLREEAQQLERQAEHDAARRRYGAQLQEVQSHLTSIEERVTRLPLARAVDQALDRVNAARAALTAATLEAEEQRTAWVRDAQDAQTKRQGLLDQYQELKDQRQRIVKAGADGVCPTCTRPLGAEYAKVLELLDRQMEEVRSNGNYYKQRIEQLQQEPVTLTEVERRRLDLEQELTGATSELARLRAQAQEAGPLKEEQNRLLVRVGELQAVLDQFLGSYDHATARDRSPTDPCFGAAGSSGRTPSGRGRPQ